MIFNDRFRGAFLGKHKARDKKDDEGRREREERGEDKNPVKTRPIGDGAANEAGNASREADGGRVERPVKGNAVLIEMAGENRGP